LSGKIDSMDNRFTGLFTGLDNRMTGIENRMTGFEGRMISLERNQNATRDDISGLRNRIDSVDGTVRLAIADGFRQHDRYLDDLNTDLAQVERQSRRINRRVERLERLEGEGA
jgi:predicted RNase H-like nuclease (RuvC/YqgF family)